jgi:hypothetical protein
MFSIQRNTPNVDSCVLREKQMGVFGDYLSHKLFLQMKNWKNEAYVLHVFLVKTLRSQANIIGNANAH